MTKDNVALAETASLLPQAAPTRDASRAMGLMLAAAGLYTLLSGYLATQLPAWQLIAQTAIMVGYCLAVGVSLRLARRGQMTAAGSLVIAALLPTTFGISALIEGLGLVMGAIAVTLSTLVAALSLPRPRTSRVIWLSVVVAVVTVVGDLYLPWPWPRAQIPALQWAAPLIAGALGLAYIGLTARRFRYYSLRTKLIITFVAVVSLAVVTITLVVGQVVSWQLTEETGQRLAVLAENKENEISQVLHSELSALRVLSLNRFVQDSLATWNRTATGDLAVLRRREAQWQASGKEAAALIDAAFDNEIASELREFQRSFPDHQDLFVTDLHGALVAATSPTANYYQADEPWWQAAYGRGVYISQPEYDEAGGTYGLIVAMPIFGHDSADIVGVLRATLSLDLFAETLAGGQFGQTGRTEIYLPDGQTLELGDAGQLVLEPGELTLAELTQSPARYLSVAEKDVSVLAGRARLGEAAGDAGLDSAIIRDLGWYVVSQQSRAEALRTVDSTARLTLLVMLAVLVAAGGVAWVVAQLLAGPIIRLTAVAAQVAGGDLKVQAPVEADDEIGALATTFNVMTTQLRETLEGLEARVADRTRALAATAEVSRRLSTILDRDQLVREVVTQVQSAFNYYHVHIYLYDERHEYLVMAGGTGEAGRTMLARGHKLLHGRGLVGRAAATGAPVLVPDTAQDPGWLANPLLPDTRSEVAVPIASGEQVLGVLDVQQATAAGLGAEDVELLQAVANQVAVALRNIAALEATRLRAEREALLGSIRQQIQGADTVAAALQVAAREVGRALGGRPVRVSLKPGDANGQH